jgi:hypothetical protein
MSTNELAWVAGVVDGEGTFGRVGRPGGRVRVVMTDVDVIERLHELTGVGLVYDRGRRDGTHKPVWEWDVTRRASVKELVRALAPLLSARRRETVERILSANGEALPAAVPPSGPARWSWIAGIIEAEGWIMPGPETVRRSPMLGVESTDRDVIDLLADLTGVGYLLGLDRRPGAWKPSWRWSVTRGDDVRGVLAAITPHLGVRRKARAEYVLSQISS